jgi:hypothetical protein
MVRILPAYADIVNWLENGRAFHQSAPVIGQVGEAWVDWFKKRKEREKCVRFTDGAVLGGRGFVDEVIRACRDRPGPLRKGTVKSVVESSRLPAKPLSLAGNPTGTAASTVRGRFPGFFSAVMIPSVDEFLLSGGNKCVFFGAQG